MIGVRYISSVSTTPTSSTTSLKKTASGESSSPRPRVNSAASRIDDRQEEQRRRERVAGDQQDHEQRHQGEARGSRRPEITVASGKTALGTGSFWRSWALPRRLFIEATMLWLKKFQNRMPARA